MNLPTILIGLVVIALFTLAIRFITKNGACAACEAQGACHSAGNGADASSGCGGKCSSCQYHEYELKAMAAKH